MFIVYSDRAYVRFQYESAALRIGNVRAGRYVPSFTETVYFGDRSDIDRSSLRARRRRKVVNFIHAHFVVGALASRKVRCLSLFRAMSLAQGDLERDAGAVTLALV